MSASAAASSLSWTTPESTTAFLCVELRSPHLFLFGTAASSLPGLLDNEHGRSFYLTAAQRGEGLVRAFEWKRRHLCADGHLRGECQELLAVCAGKVRYRAHAALSPE